MVFPDHFVYVNGVGSRRAIEKALFDLRPGVTELYVHPAADTPSCGRSHPTGRPGSTTCTSCATTPASGHGRALRRHLIGYREPRELQRAGA